MSDTEHHADLNPELPPLASTEHPHESADMALSFALFTDYLDNKLGGAVASWLVHLSLDGVVWVQALARDTMLCSWARHVPLTVPLSTQ